MEDAFRREVRLLTTRLGAIVQEQCGQSVFAAIESLRKLSKQLRQNPDPELLKLTEREVNRLSLGEAADVAHAFSLFFHLVNLCEERQRVRRLAAYESEEAGAPMSLRHTFNELRRHHVSPSEVERLLNSMRIEPVLTAHPTEAKRRSVINHLLRIARTLETCPTDQSAAAASALDTWIESLWLTDEVRERAVAPQTEIESTLVFLERTVFEVAASFWEKFREELHRFAPELRASPFLGFGSWVGGDRDGNPNVTPQVSLEAADRLRRSILAYYLHTCRRMLGLVSFPCRPPALERKMLRDLEDDMRRFPATRVFQELDQPRELYRRKLRVIIWRLERTEEGGEGAYENVQQFVADVGKLERALREQSIPRVARAGPGKLRLTAEVFGFHAASLDFRQHSSVTRAAADELLRAAGFRTAPEADRIRSIQEVLSNCSLRLPEAQDSANTLEEFRALRQIQTRYGEPASQRYVLSMTANSSDIWDVLLLGYQAGLVRCSGDGLASCIDVIPLFETYDDLRRCPAILDELLSDPLYRRLLKSRHEFQEVMLGYSDSVKDAGYVAANFALFRAQKRLGEVAERHGVRLGLFHGIGGTIDRGGGQSYRSVRAQPYAAPGGRIRITEQGEVISLKYSNPVIARRNIEQLTSSVLDAHLLRPKLVNAEKLEKWEEYAEELAASSRSFYRQLVYETPDFPQYFCQATPIDLIERLRLGSRPSRRFRSDDLRDLRAIPWVFAWTQSRHFLPSWYGLGYALEKFAGDRPEHAGHGPGGLPLLREMYQGWPFFAVLIDNAELSLAKTDLDIAGRYAALVHPPHLGDRIFRLIEEEYRRSRRGVLEICGHAHLLARQPVLAESIRLRNPYVDPLNFLQIRLLKRWRKDRRVPPGLLHLLQLTVAGVAFGMKSTG
jgi:phosphoenolpyruvate carboxylase